MRCSSCNKFVSFEEADPEVQTPEVDDDGHVTVEVRIVNNCADCGEELKEATLELEGDVSHTCDPKKVNGDKSGYEVEEESSERVTKGEGAGRYRKTFYGASVTLKVTCQKCSGDETLELSDYIQASSMDELG